LKSGDSYLSERKRDGARQDERHTGGSKRSPC
jgi:hypothetical protein